jgi:hypothetical protein
MKSAEPEALKSATKKTTEKQKGEKISMSRQNARGETAVRAHWHGKESETV